MKPELLAPAGDRDCLRAAAANGADAIYLGLPAFNARMRADNFTFEGLPETVRYAHDRGMRVYVTLNTLVFTRELERAAAMIAACHAAEVDALIVQDLGVVRLARTLAPEMEVHASTQMTVTSPEGAAFAGRLGVSRVVLARELSLREMERFGHGETPGLEVFVHGALCVAYSGQCLTSEALGQRSANRGECAQACRLPYELIVDGQPVDLGDRRYLLSPQDLAAVAEVPELIRVGVASFKIEGRLKSPEYVAAICQVYRRAIDAAWAARQAGRPAPDTTPDPGGQYQMEMAFSRGLFSGWLHGVNHQRLVHGRFGKKRGAFVGRVARSGPDHVAVAMETAVAPGDGVVFDTGGDTDKEQGGRVFEVRGDRLFFERGRIRFGEIRPGDRVWKTSDPRLDRALRKSFDRDPPPRARTADMAASGRAGACLEVAARSGGRSATARSAMALAPAANRPLTAEVLERQLGRLGGTGFVLGKLHADLPEAVMLPLSELNRMRRELVAKLAGHPDPAPNAESPPRRDGAPAPAASGGGPLAPPRPRVEMREPAAAVRALLPEPGPREAGPPVLHVLCRTLEQIETALELGCESLYADFEDIRRYKDAVARVRARGGARIFLATPRIQKSGEQGFFKLIENAGPDGVLVRNLGGIEAFRESAPPKIGDFSLNCANPLAAGILLGAGLERVTASCDLNAEQLADLLEGTPAGRVEIILHQHLPMFHMEHCVYAAFLSDGTDHTNCGRPCDRHDVRLRDRVGMEHPLRADVGCRNTLFHARAQSGAGFFREFRAAGAAHFRVELLDEKGDVARGIVSGYRDLLDGRVEAKALLAAIRAVDQLGVTSGTLTVLGT